MIVIKKKKVALVIADGWGIRDKREANAIALAKTPNFDKLKERFDYTELQASGLDVGLPVGQIGNSEVGHLNLGAGAVIYQDITRIDKAILDGEFALNPAFNAAMDRVKQNGGSLHLGGLLSDGGVHSTIKHLFALLKMAKQKGLEKVFVHCFMDGRDVAPNSGIDYIRQLVAFLDELGVGKIASISGRFYIMDRDNRFERVERGFNAMTAGRGREFDSAIKAMEYSYANEVYDEFVEPCVITVNGKYEGGFNDGDSFICYNFRADRAREFSRAIIEKDFSEFERKKGYLDIFYVGMTEYDASFKGIYTAFEPKKIQNTLGERIAKLGLRQLRLAETEKYAHVTFFFNGGVEKANALEERILIPSPKVATYDQTPKMSALKITEQAIKSLRADEFDVLILNYANCDMVGHTGKLDATICAVETVDSCLGELTQAFFDEGGVVFIVADHGNAELMSLEDGSVWTAHTTNPVPFIAADPSKHIDLSNVKKLADVADVVFEAISEIV